MITYKLMKTAVIAGGIRQMTVSGTQGDRRIDEPVLTLAEDECRAKEDGLELVA